MHKYRHTSSVANTNGNLFPIIFFIHISKWENIRCNQLDVTNNVLREIKWKFSMYGHCKTWDRELQVGMFKLREEQQIITCNGMDNWEQGHFWAMTLQESQYNYLLHNWRLSWCKGMLL